MSDISYQATSIFNQMKNNRITDIEGFWTEYSKNFDEFEIPKVRKEFESAAKKYTETITD